MARRFIWSGERRGARDRESERARRCHAAYESYMYGRITVAFTVRLQHQNAKAGGTNPIVHLQALVRQRHVLVEAEPGVAWNPLPPAPWIARDASSCMRLCTYARLISLSASHLSLSLSVHCACFVATRLRPALAACNYCVLRTPNRKFPPPRPHEVGVGGACRLGSLNGADQAPTAQGRLLA
jgi:hypothetical protein